MVGILVCFLLGPAYFQVRFAVSTREGISSRLLHPCVSARFSAKVEVLQEPVAFLGVSDVTIDGGLVHDENLRERPHQNANPPDPPPQKVRPLSMGCFLTLIVQLSFNDPLIRLSYLLRFYVAFGGVGGPLKFPSFSAICHTGWMHPKWMMFEFHQIYV